MTARFRYACRRGAPALSDWRGRDAKGPTVPSRKLLPLLLLASLGARVEARVWHVDWDGGNDAAPGTATGSAWKHAPGDGQATGVPARTRLGPGDRVIFRGGVRYRGTIRVIDAGTADAPIVFTGAGWGATPAIIDGSDLLPPPVRCASASACLGARDAVSVAVPADADWSRWLFGTSGAYAMAQWPAALAGQPYDDTSRYATVPRDALGDLQGGRIAARGLDALGGGAPVLVLWSRPNVLRYTRDFRVAPDGLAFVAADFIPYPDRDNRFSILNAPALVDRPGSYAISGADGRAVLRLRPGDARLSLGSGRGGFVLAKGAAHVVIRDLVFANFAARPLDIRSGVPVLAIAPTDGVAIVGNEFRDSVLLNGQGVININFARNLRVNGNRIARIAFGSGIRIGSGMGPMEVACNSVEDIGRTAIAAVNAHTVTIRGNVIRRVNGIHGNGITSYQDNRVVRIVDNVVIDSIRPLTLNVPGKVYFPDDPNPPDTRITGNILIGNDPKVASAINWGKGLRNVTFRDNLLGGAMALRLQGDESGSRVENNRLAGALVLTRPGGDIAQRGNGRIGGGELAQALARRLAAQAQCR